MSTTYTPEISTYKVFNLMVVQIMKPLFNIGLQGCGFKL